MTAPRPKGVAALAILELLGGVVAVLYGIAGIDLVSGVANIAVGVVALVLGYGLWSGKRWGWTLGVAFSALDAVYFAVGNGYTALATGSAVSAAVGTVGTAVALLILVYLTRPKVKTYFGRGPPPIQPTDASPPPP